MEILKENPFVVLTPDDKGGEREVEITSAAVIHRLFVDVFEDFRTIPQQGHVFLNGPRGSGKSMMFRFLLPDCQLIDRKASRYSELPFFSIHIPIKLTSINNPEYDLIGDFGSATFNEHILTLYFTEIIFDSFAKLNFDIVENRVELLNEIKEFYFKTFLRRLKLCGMTGDDYDNFDPKSPHEGFELVRNVCSELFMMANQFLKRNLPSSSQRQLFAPVQYSGPLCDYLSFLFPILKELKNISMFPKKPFFLLVDDADNLTTTQVIVLNTWVSYRTNSEISLKISTQLNYPTYNTINGTNIDSPHDYYDINILTTYSSQKAIYNTRVRQIVEKRLNYFFDSLNERISPSDFFPSDSAQDAGISKEREALSIAFEEGKGRGYRASDDITRYAIPNYIAKLRGSSKSGSTFKYAGFDMLVSISSGVIRHFLKPAAKMFNAQLRDIRLKNPDALVTEVRLISPSIQDEEIRAHSVDQLFDEYDKLKKDVIQAKRDNEYLTKIEKLKNLIDGLGGLFSVYLTDMERSERKIFSFAISGAVNTDLQAVLDLGVRLGYFHKATTGRKSGKGRTRLYILSRILAPHYLLDPTGFAHYKFFTSDKLMRAMHKPESFINEMTARGTDNNDDIQAVIEFDLPREI